MATRQWEEENETKLRKYFFQNLTIGPKFSVVHLAIFQGILKFMKTT